MAYKALAQSLEELEMVMSPCDPCVWSAVVMNTQLTLLFHADEVLLSHEKLQALTDYIKLLDRAYGKSDPLTVTR